MSAQPSPRSRPARPATARPASPLRGGDARPRPRLRIAPEVARRRLRTRLLVWAAALVTAASLFTLVAFHVFAAQSAFTLERLSKERSNEQLRYERLREEVANLSSAPTVINAATRLGMVQGATVVNLPVAVSVPAATGTAAGTPAGTGTYAKTKRALGPTP